VNDFVYVNGYLFLAALVLAGIGLERLFIDAVRGVDRLLTRRGSVQKGRHGESARKAGEEIPQGGEKAEDAGVLGQPVADHDREINLEAGNQRSEEQAE
jgi:hypothetical protein